MVFVSLIGTSSSGKNTVADYLIQKHGFKRVKVAEGAVKDSSALGLSSQESAELSSALASTSLQPSPTDIADSLVFPDTSTLLNQCTKNWLEHYVTTDLTTAEELDPFVKRPFFLVVGVDGPMGKRYERERKRAQARGKDLTLQQFIDQHDVDMNATSASSFTAPPSLNPRPLEHNPSPTSPSFPFNHARSPSTTSRGNKLAPPGSAAVLNGVTELAAKPEPGSVRKALAYSQVTVLNNFGTKEELWAHLDELDLLNAERLRPGWDTYFMTLASLASLRSNCMKRRVGALLVRSKRILSTGYNGTPRGLVNCNEGGCRRCNGAANGGEGLAECLCLHAEENALLEVGRDRIGTDAILYCNTCPCLTCSVKIVQTGVREVVYNLNYSMDDASARVLKEGGVILRQLVMPHATT